MHVRYCVKRATETKPFYAIADMHILSLATTIIMYIRLYISDGKVYFY